MSGRLKTGNIETWGAICNTIFYQISALLIRTVVKSAEIALYNHNSKLAIVIMIRGN